MKMESLTSKIYDLMQVYPKTKEQKNEYLKLLNLLHCDVELVVDGEKIQNFKI